MTWTASYARSIIHFLFISATLFASFTSCHSLRQKPPYAEGTKDGYILAQKYCGTCHRFVPASAINRQNWDNRVLPAMAPHLGISVFAEKEYLNSLSAVLSFNDWQKIVEYYVKSSPPVLSVPQPSTAIIRDWSVFELKKPAVQHIFPSRTTLTAIDTVTDMIYTADGNTNYLYRWNNRLQLIDSVLTPSPAVSAIFYNALKKREGIFTSIGILNASDLAHGELLHFDLSRSLKQRPDTLVTALPRSVCTVSADFNRDGLVDYAVCGFGHTKGGLYLLEQLPDGGFKKKSLLEIPGAIQATTGDFNNDGYMDLMVLFANADESIRLFINDKKGGFTIKKLLSFLPVYGSTSFQLADFNGDGLPDILYTCGDNADLSQVFKPYHGVYIYLNKGDFKFEQSYFYHINGCTKAVAADFDGDGDLDIVTIAFFADFRNNPAEKFLYFQQNGPMHFQPYSPPIDNYGRWLCMEVKDYDHDGDPDIVLGNFAEYILTDKNYRPGWNKYLPVIVLENKTLSPKAAQ